MSEANDVQIDTQTPQAQESAPDMLKAALNYAKRGWKVFPVHSPIASGRCSCGNSQCKKIGKHPRIKAWNTEATTDIGKINNWWSQWPNANIGVVTGFASGIWVLDVDHKNMNGSTALEQLEKRFGPLPDTLTASTGSGYHCYFVHPGHFVHGSVQDVGDGLDVRGDGQYVVAPRSLHSNGKRYEWRENHDIASAPDWLLSIVTAEPVAPQECKLQAVPDISPLSAAPTHFPEGIRNNSLFRIACYLFSSGMARERVELAMLLLNKVKCQPQLSTAEVKALVQSASTYAQQDDSGDAHENDSEASPTRRRKRKTKSRAPIFWHKNIPSQNLSDAQLFQLEDYQLGWRSRALDFAFAQGCLLPDDTAQIRKLVRPSNRKKFENEWRLALYDFKPIELDGRAYLYHPVLFSEYVDAVSQALVNRANAEKAHMEKTSGPQPKPPVTPMVRDAVA